MFKVCLTITLLFTTLSSTFSNEAIFESEKLQSCYDNVNDSPLDNIPPKDLKRFQRIFSENEVIRRGLFYGYSRCLEENIKTISFNDCNNFADKRVFSSSDGDTRIACISENIDKITSTECFKSAEKITENRRENDALWVCINKFVPGVKRTPLEITGVEL